MKTSIKLAHFNMYEPLWDFTTANNLSTLFLSHFSRQVFEFYNTPRWVTGTDSAPAG